MQNSPTPTSETTSRFSDINRDVSGQILHLKNRAKSGTSATSAHSNNISIPENLFEISDRFSERKGAKNNDTEQKIRRAVDSSA